MDVQRFAERFGGVGAQSVLDAIGGSSMVTTAGVLAMDGREDYRAVRAAWDQDPCSPTAANDVVKIGAELIAEETERRRHIQHVVIIGDDEQFPMARMGDPTSIGNESHYEESAESIGAPLATSLASGYYFSDDPLVDPAPAHNLGWRRHLPRLSLGRLVSTPDEILAQLEEYTATEGRVINRATNTAPTVRSYGYDFMADGARLATQALVGQSDDYTTDADPWGTSELLEGLRDENTLVHLIYAHFDHRAAWSARKFGDPWSADPNLTPALAAAHLPYGARLLVTMGCHSGLPIPFSVAGSNLSFARAIAGSRSATYVSVTAYSYGDTQVADLHERLLSEFAAGVAEGQSLGESLRDAKLLYAAQAGRYGQIDDKVIQSTVLYGLPMYRVEHSSRLDAPDPVVALMK
jgi:hypothetical protein